MGYQQILLDTKQVDWRRRSPDLAIDLLAEGMPLQIEGPRGMLDISQQMRRRARQPLENTRSNGRKKTQIPPMKAG